VNVGAALGIQPEQRFLAVVPFSHANGFSNCMFLPLVHGATVVLMPAFEPRRLASIVRTHRIQVLIVSPFILRMLAEQKVDAGCFRSVDICLSSGAATPPALAELWKDQFGIRVRQLYGSSETGTVSIEAADGPIGCGAVGRPIPEVEVRILDEHGAQRAANEIGEVFVRSPAMMPGYLGEPRRNQTVFRKGFFRTGDLGVLDGDNNLVLAGRKTRTINVGGVKVDPGEVEAVIERMPGVCQCRAMGVPDRWQSETIKVVVAVGEEHNRSRRELVEHCRRFLAEYKIPRLIEFVDAIPVDLTGKQVMSWGRD
jgi:long-chain acyl-CoA synthetase